ncbi:MAG: YdiY family protein [bacterium]
MRTLAVVFALVTQLMCAATAPARAADLGWSGAAELGFAESGGNTDVLSLLSKARVAHADSNSTIALAAGVLYGESDGAKNSQKLDGALNADYYPWGRWSVFSFATVLNNPFRDIRVRATGALGAKWSALAGRRGGASISVAGIREYEEARSSEATKRRFLYSWRTKAELRFGAAARLTQITFLVQDFDKPFEDYRVDSDTELTVPIEGRVDLSAAFSLDYENEPRPGVERTDRRVTTSLVVTWD